MSQLKKIPGVSHKSASFDFPRAAYPPTPPDTEADSFSTMHPPFYTPSNLKADISDSFTTGGLTDTPTNRPVSRKASNLSYISSGIARADQRFGSPRPAATRWLVVVSPPAALIIENGSSMFLNATRPESQSILLPLFPSLSRQLSAVAREFSFPSTSGICLFLRLADQSMPFSSRLSDESWSILWAHVLYEERPVPGSSTGGLPIAGQLEFDIDLRKARWYDAWSAAMRRELESTPISSTPSLTNHAREDSRATQHTDHDSDELTISGPKRRSRHVPRKLSLIEKLDSNSSVRSLSRPASRQGQSPPHHEGFPLHALSPIPQLDEPKSAIRVLESKVENWRASAAFPKSPLTQTEPTLLPVTVPSSEHAEEEDQVQELNLDDFAWSISSAGPSDVPWSAVSFGSDRAPSVDIANRLEGSVCLTPSTCTSWGPADYSIYSLVSEISRLPSPDLAYRQYEHIPLTPSTATSWGPPVDWDDLPLSAMSRAPSVDLAGRAMSSRPCTPSTATSWGAPLEWPETPASPYRVRSPDIGQRAFDLDHNASVSALAPWHHVWPYTEHGERNSSLSDSRRPQDLHDTEKKAESDSTGFPWKLVWPYRQQASSSISDVSICYPFFDIYPAVYPHFDLYPALPEVAGPAAHLHAELRPAYPQLNIYPAVYPYFEIYPGHVVGPQQLDEPLLTALPKVYPALDIYTVVYPAFEIYPGNVIQMQEGNVMTSLSIELLAHYPAFDLYPAVYPNFVIYPSVIVAEDAAEDLMDIDQRVLGLSHSYPNFDIYPAVYPYNLDSVYPPVNVKNDVTSRAPVNCTLPQRAYPSLNIYPSVYPNLEIYPPVAEDNENVDMMAQGVATKDHVVVVALGTSYPVVEPYPPAYPHLRIYPEVLESGDIHCEAIQFVYPNLDIYPAVYPYFDIYKSGCASTPNVLCVDEISVPVTYPCSIIYPAVYPYFDIYNTGHPTLAETEEHEVETLTLKAQYPLFNLYPAVYPYFDIYSSGFPTLAETESSVEVGAIALASSYPNFNIYPAVYPHFDIYSSGSSTVAGNVYKAAIGATRLQSSYPRLDIYPPVYPFFDIYNEQGLSLCASSDVNSSTTGPARKPRKSHQELYEAVISRLEFDSRSVHQQDTTKRRKTHDELYSAVIARIEAKSDSDALKIDTCSVAEKTPGQTLQEPRSFFETGSPVKPSEIRRSSSLNRGTPPPPAVPSLRRFASTSDGTTSNHNRHNLTTRSPLSVYEPITEATANEESTGSPMRKKPARRDSIVLEKARHWGSPASQTQSSPAVQYNQITVEDLSAFPMPPMPPLPSKPNYDLNKPIAKLDRSKLPFH